MRPLAISLLTLAAQGSCQAAAMGGGDVAALLQSRSLVLFLGNGPRYQYRSVPAVLDALDAPLGQIGEELGPWVAVFGGDSCVDSAPDLGVVMREVKARHGVPLLAVAAWDVEDHVDYVFRYESQVCEATGRELYGGVDGDGEPVGGTAVYLRDWLPRLGAVVAISPQGRVGRAELQYARGIDGLRVIEVPADARFPQPG